jgi:hypothetical protein
LYGPPGGVAEGHLLLGECAVVGLETGSRFGCFARSNPRLDLVGTTLGLQERLDAVRGRRERPFGPPEPLPCRERYTARWRALPQGFSEGFSERSVAGEPWPAGLVLNDRERGSLGEGPTEGNHLRALVAHGQDSGPVHPLPLQDAGSGEKRGSCSAEKRFKARVIAPAPGWGAGDVHGGIGVFEIVQTSLDALNHPAVVWRSHAKSGA